MGKTVFILGAGASVASGVPVMADFLDTSEMLLVNGRAGSDHGHFVSVFEGLHKLQGVFAKSQIDVRNLESVFIAFEMASLLGAGIGGFQIKQSQVLGHALRRVIVRTIDETMRFHVRGMGEISPPVAYDAFGRFLGRAKVGDATVITFNYDCGLDYALAYHGVKFDYQIPYPGVDLPIFKLHGSLNWESRSDGTVHIHPLCPASVSSLPLEWQREPKTIRLLFSDGAAARMAGDVASPFEPVIVPPTWSKAEHHTKISKVWTQAARALATAENIVIAGFSLPPTDEFFRYLFALGTISSTIVKFVGVLDSFPSPALNERFLSLLGPMTRGRYHLRKLSFQQLADSLDSSGLENTITNVKSMPSPF